MKKYCTLRVFFLFVLICFFWLTGRHRRRCLVVTATFSIRFHTTTRLAKRINANEKYCRAQ